MSGTLAAPAPLAERLRAAGLPAALSVETHANRRVLVSLTRRGALRVHSGYAMAPDPVLAAIATWARPRVPGAVRRAAQRILTAFPVHQHVPPAPRRPAGPKPVRPEEALLEIRLQALHGELNARHFGGGLGGVRLLWSARMRRRLGEYRPRETEGTLPEIRLSLRHLRRDGWAGIRETLLHEMVHQWQDQGGRRLGHDAAFRRRCDAIGIDGRAVRRDLPRTQSPTLHPQSSILNPQSSILNPQSSAVTNP